MEWEQKGTQWVAAGEDGTFIISRSKGLYWARYESSYTVFRLPPNKSIKQVKKICQDNFYWEE